MKWLEITVITNREFSDIVSLTLIEAGSEGTVVRDSFDIEELRKSSIYWDYIDDALLSERDERVFVSGFFVCGFDMNIVIESIARIKASAECETGSLEISKKEIDSVDWENEWKKHYLPIVFDRFAIVPRWIKNHGLDDKRLILLDPGMAFGTGSHETTSMCLHFLDGIDIDGKTLIDVGCGSGILGIAGAVLGAKKCILTDIDPDAVKCAVENAELNGVADRVSVEKADLFKDFEILEKADILTANLTAPLLLLLKAKLGNYIKKGAFVIISGIITDRVAEVETVYGKDFEVVAKQIRGDWCAFLLKN